MGLTFHHRHVIPVTGRFQVRQHLRGQLADHLAQLPKQAFIATGPVQRHPSIKYVARPALPTRTTTTRRHHAPSRRCARRSARGNSPRRWTRPACHLLANLSHQLGPVDWLRRIVVAPGIQALLLFTRHCVGRQRDNRPLVAFFPQQTCRPVSVQQRHVHVHQNDIKRLAILHGRHRQLHRDLAIVGNHHRRPQLLQQ